MQRVPLVLAADQSTLHPSSHAAREIEQLWWILLAISAVVFAVVTLLVVAAVLRRRGRRNEAAADTRRVQGLVLLGGFAVPLAVLVALFVLTLRTLPATSAPKGHIDLTVEVTGRQWFWDVRYPGSDAVTANEIHIPAGQRVRLVAKTGDVVHSFWVPRLNRKIDMIPGKTNSILLRADHPGVYRGQCAEFCGLQHANMAFLVIADAPTRFRAWLAREAGPATGRARGKPIFESYCGGCHTIRGTEAQGKIGPDLTHVAARRTLAANTIPNARGYLAGWILDPQHVKPGNKMPGLDLAGDQVQTLVDYLSGLK
jgi:cytochrome c oxidase subunit 2